MTRIGVKMGGDPLTFFGLAGMGDLIVTCVCRSIPETGCSVKKSAKGKHRNRPSRK